MSAALDVVNAKSKINTQIKQLQVEALEVGVKLDTASAKQAIKQLQTQQDSFYKRNLSEIDAEIAKRRQASEIFSQQIKSQMQIAIQSENAVAAVRKKSVVDDTFTTRIKSSQQDLLRLKDTFSAIGNNANLSAQWQGLFDSSKIVKSNEELQKLNAKIGLFRKEIGASNALLDQAAIKALKAIAVMKAFQLSVVAIRSMSSEVVALDTSLTELQKEFGAVGIAIEDANGELRSTYDILADYANIYDTLSSKQQQFLSELASGKRQVPVINAIVQQWDDVSAAIEQSSNSFGSAERENAIFMESIQGKLNLLKSTFQEFATDTIDSNLVKSIVDLGTASLKTVDSLGGLQNILVLITGLLVAKNWNTITSAFAGIVGKVKDIPTAFRTAKQESAGLSGALNLLGISASTAVVTIGIAAYNAYKQAEEEARQTALAAADEANQQTIAITELTGKYLKLAEAVDLDGDSKKELLSLQQQLLKNFDLEGESIDDLTKKYGGLTEAIKEKTLENARNKTNTVVSAANTLTAAFAEQNKSVADLEAQRATLVNDDTDESIAKQRSDYKGQGWGNYFIP